MGSFVYTVLSPALAGHQDGFMETVIGGMKAEILVTLMFVLKDIKTRSEA